MSTLWRGEALLDQEPRGVVKVHAVPPEGAIAAMDVWLAGVQPRVDAIGARASELRHAVASSIWPLYERAWRDDEEDLAEDPSAPRPAINADDLATRLALELIDIGDNGQVSLHYHDGGMFLGHVVVAELDVADAITRVSLAG